MAVTQDMKPEKMENMVDAAGSRRLLLCEETGIK
jgi:hypothetical protein